MTSTVTEKPLDNPATCFSLLDHTIHLSGKGEVVIPPDRARLIVSVLNKKATTDEVVKSVTKRLDYIKGTMKTFGVKDRDLRLTRSLVQEDKEYIMYAEVEAVFHNLENSQNVAIQLIQKLGKSISVSGPHFFHSCQAFEKGKRRATLEAMKACHEKAAELASVFGAKVVKPLLISEEYNKLVLQDGSLPPTNITAEQMKKNLKNRQLPDKLGLILYVESSAGLLDLREICRTAIRLSNEYPFILEGLVFGSDDFCADIGATRTPELTELLMARQQIVLVAKSFRLQAIDVVHIDYKDLVGLKKQSAEGCQMGFTGKQVIHPGQVPIVQEAFSPSPQRIAWASELIQVFEEHQHSGKGAFTFQGMMIDKPLLLQAKNILQMAKLIEEKN